MSYENTFLLINRALRSSLKPNYRLLIYSPRQTEPRGGGILMYVNGEHNYLKHDVTSDDIETIPIEMEYYGQLFTIAAIDNPQGHIWNTDDL